MPLFSSTEEAAATLGKFIENVAVDPELKAKWVSSNVAFRMNYTDPELVIVLDASQDPPVVRQGDAAKASDVEIELFMDTDTGHKFWLGDLNVPMALARRKIKVKGPVGKLLQLLPAMQPAFIKYNEYLAAQGFDRK
ncbi:MULTISPECIES: hypothetical protein [Rhodococcus]|uniref:SCP2 domain-containing protein n=1 Tax=Rhodococcus opacus TaxID=37919 RepID=A0A2S8J698_RHOOP|nr:MULTISPECIES: hypothetical protein [Rhodococcus]MDI9947728.1 hypothetical protein [Rhodococcus sp. IEGM 1305]PQP22591.1 hypothetical protein C5613_23335 [Rhodococcus opacus]TQC43711.1 hypothetical protein EEB14_41455 [Rhodococcus sp. WS4]